MTLWQKILWIWINAPLSQNIVIKIYALFQMFWDWKANYAYFFHFKNVWTGNAAQSDKYIYFDDHDEIAETGYSAD